MWMNTVVSSLRDKAAVVSEGGGGIGRAIAGGLAVEKRRFPCAM